MRMNVLEMAREDFEKVPAYDGENWDFGTRFNSLVILPTGRIHEETGYACMAFCAVDKEDAPLIRFDRTIDILRLDGLGGNGLGYEYYGKHLEDMPEPLLKAKGWAIDCLPCGYLRVLAKCPMYLDERGPTDYFKIDAMDLFAEDEAFVYE